MGRVPSTLDGPSRTCTGWRWRGSKAKTAPSTCCDPAENAWARSPRGLAEASEGRTLFRLVYAWPFRPTSCGHLSPTSTARPLSSDLSTFLPSDPEGTACPTCRGPRAQASPGHVAAAHFPFIFRFFSCYRINGEVESINPFPLYSIHRGSRPASIPRSNVTQKVTRLYCDRGVFTCSLHVRIEK